jgi:SPP1 Gp6-like portal protein
LALSNEQALQLATELMAQRQAEKPRLDRVLSYRRDGVAPNGVLSDGRLAGLPAGVPDEVRSLAKISRVNLTRYVVSARVQNMYVDGFQTPDSPDNTAAWDVWQRNGMDARQIGVHRGALTYGAAYVVVLPGDPVPVVRGVSPRKMTVGYGDDDQWPVAGLEQRRNKKWRLIDATSIYEFKGDDGGELEFLGAQDHGAGVTPIVRFRDTLDLDVDVEGVVEPLMLLQDQVNITSFGLQVAQHYGAFRQRYIIGWLADSESEALKTGASKLMMFEDSPDDVKVGEFSQTELRGYIESREATIRHLATVSQTPVHELMGQFVNISADALEAARASHSAGVEENKISVGESWEQVLNLATELMGGTPDAAASVVWRDTRVRSPKEAAEAFGLLVEKLGVPPRALWPRIPGVSQHELAQWAALADEPDAFDSLAAILDKAAGPNET